MRNWLEVTILETGNTVLFNLDQVVSFGPSIYQPGHVAVILRGEQAIVHVKESYQEIREAIFES